MADIYCKFDTGDDTTGNGSLATPYKTLAKGMTVHNKNDVIKLLADELIATKVTLNTYAEYTYSTIIGVNAAGVEDGTRRRLYGNASCDYALYFGAASTYCWRISNIDFDNFTAYAIQTTHVHYNSIFSNFTVTRCNGLLSSISANLATIEDFVIDSCRGPYCIYATSASIRNGIISNCIIGNGYAIYTTVSASRYRNIIISNVSVTGTNYGILYPAGADIKNLIIDRIAITGAVSNLINTCSMEDCIISNITMSGATSRQLFVAVTTPLIVKNIALYNIIGDPVIYKPTATIDIFTKNVYTLTTSPYQTDDGNDYTLHPGYAHRRKMLALSANSGLWERQTA